MLELPFLTALESAERVLLAGAGGGFDVFSGLPLFFGLRNAGKEVHLANLSFSVLETLKSPPLMPGLYEVTSETMDTSPYFPELHLARWFRDVDHRPISIYCFEPTGVRTLAAAYRHLVQRLDIDTVLLVDGGTDSLMRGDEIGLGTPHEDIASLLAVDELDLPRKILACIGFGVDRYHGVCHAHFLEAVAELTRAKGYLGMFSLLETMPEVRQFRAATEAVFAAMPHDISIVASSILSALAGRYGNSHATSRTRGSELWINPLMPVYWGFDVASVAERVLYREEMMSTVDFHDVMGVVNRFRTRCPSIRPRAIIPV